MPGNLASILLLAGTTVSAPEANPPQLHGQSSPNVAVEGPVMLIALAQLAQYV